MTWTGHHYPQAWTGTDADGIALEREAIAYALRERDALRQILAQPGRRLLGYFLQAHDAQDWEEVSILVHLLHAHARSAGKAEGLGLYPSRHREKSG